MSPRPILKPSPMASVRSSFRAGRVHFPPTPNLSATYTTHSGNSYDRSAIVVSPNDCQLPERNCPERTYVLSEGRCEARLLKAVQSEEVDMDEDEDAQDTPLAGPNTIHPQGVDYFSFSPPTLTPDMTSSESEDSDGLISPLNEVEPTNGQSMSVLNLPISDGIDIPNPTHSPKHVHTALAFLPHALPPPRDRKSSLSPRDRERKKEKTTLSEGDNARVPSTSRRRALSNFTPAAIVPDLDCLDGF